MKRVNVILFDDFTTLDALGPAEVLSRLKERFAIEYYSFQGGAVKSSTGSAIETMPMDQIVANDILLIPGGFGTRQLVDDSGFIAALRERANASELVLSVCTGSALLAKAGVLNDKKATSNKMSWDWVVSQAPDVRWIRKARWVVDGKFYTSSGITAGIDMALGFVSDTIGANVAKKIADSLEYIWNADKDIDPFA